MSIKKKETKKNQKTTPSGYKKSGYQLSGMHNRRTQGK